MYKVEPPLENHLVEQTVAAEALLHFLQEMCNMLRTPFNLHPWGMRKALLCRLCAGKGTMVGVKLHCKQGLVQVVQR